MDADGSSASSRKWGAEEKNPRWEGRGMNLDSIVFGVVCDKLFFNKPKTLLKTSFYGSIMSLLFI